MAGYHYSPRTKKSAACRAATPEKCPLKPIDGKPVPHFATKRDAEAYAQKQWQEEHGSFTTLSKKSAPTSGKTSMEGSGALEEDVALVPETMGEDEARPSRVGGTTTLLSPEEQQLASAQALAEKYMPHEPVVFSEDEADALASRLYDEYEALMEDDPYGDVSQAINQYAANGYLAVNRLLREDMKWDTAQELIEESEEDLMGSYVEDPEDLLDQVDTVVSVLDALQERTNAQEQPVRNLYRYRVVSHHEKRRLMERLQPGTTMRDQGYTSTTEDPSLMAGIAHKETGERRYQDTVVFQIASDQGISLQQNPATDRLAFQPQDFEFERLLPRNSELVVVGVEEQTFSVSEERKGMHRFFNYQGMKPTQVSKVPPQKLTVVRLVDKSLLFSETAPR